MNLTPHFTLAEFERSATANRLGVSNKMNDTQLVAAKALCSEILEVIRAHYKAAIVITSGYRSPVVNKAVGGSSSSQHCKGEAADFTVVGKSVESVFSDIKHGKIKGLRFDQVIHEGTWIHISYRKNRLRGECLIFKNGKYQKG